MNRRLSLLIAALLAFCLALASGTAARSAEEILGNPDYLAMSFGGYRETTRERPPSVEQLMEDVRIMHALGIRIVRTYNTQQYPHAARLLEAIDRLQQENPDLEFYVMLGAWIDCYGAWTQETDHSRGSVENNTAEINAAVRMANEYPRIVKAIAVGNEAMVHWASSYYVEPDVVLRWVNHLQQLKKEGGLSPEVWITSSDNFASWGGDDPSYHKPALEELIRAVDFVSLHTYPFHDTHYNGDFWIVPEEEAALPKEEQIAAAMRRARDYARQQYESTAAYVQAIAPGKPIHIGESGWATNDTELYSAKGSRAADEYKSGLFHDLMREWTNAEGIALFYFEMFDEPWKDAYNPGGSENHFGLINLQGRAKYALWDEVDAGVFDGLSRGGNPIGKTFGSNKAALLATVLPPTAASDSTAHTIRTMNDSRQPGEPVTEDVYIVLHTEKAPDNLASATYPSAPLRINPWEGTCEFHRNEQGALEIKTGAGEWWGCALEMKGEQGEDLSRFAGGTLHFEIKGSPALALQLGFQTGFYPAGNQVNNFVAFGPGEQRQLTAEWTAHAIPLAELNQGANLADVMSPLAFLGTTQPNQDVFFVRNIWYSAE